MPSYKFVYGQKVLKWVIDGQKLKPVWLAD